MITADARTLLTLVIRGNFVKLRDDGAFLLRLRLLRVADGIALILFVQIEVVGITATTTASHADLTLVASKFGRHISVLVPLNVVHILPEGCVGIA